MPKNYNYTINGARGMCASMILVFHIWRSGRAGGILDEPSTALVFALDSLQIGVPIFFMVSGYVILGSLVRHGTPGPFLIDRFIRIYSTWLPSLIAAAIVQYAFGIKAFADASADQAAWIFIANVLLLPPFIDVPLLNNVSWSLTYEWVFYFIAAVAILSRKTETVLIAGIVLAAAIIHWYMLFFLPGILAFRYANTMSIGRWSIAGLIVLICAFQMREIHPAYAALSVAVAFPVFSNLATGTHFEILGHEIFQFLGNISYSLYLWHVLVISAVRRILNIIELPAEPLIFWLVCTVISLLVAWISWRLFEVRMTQYARHWLRAKPLSQSRTGI